MVQDDRIFARNRRNVPVVPVAGDPSMMDLDEDFTREALMPVWKFSQVRKKNHFCYFECLLEKLKN